MDAVNVVVTCTKTKTADPARECALRSVPRGTVQERAAQWVRRLKKHASEAVSTEDLYSGDHWRVVRDLYSPHFKIRIWVCSAGYGLIRLTDCIAPYSATFSAKHPDSVCRGVSDAQGDSVLPRWWARLARWPGPSCEAPRSVTQLVDAYPRSPLLVVASERYLDAIQEDLEAAAARLADHENLMIISAGTKNLGDLNPFLIPCDARLQALVGGVRRSLNIRVARKVLFEARTIPRLTALQRRYRKILENQPLPPVYGRHPLTDLQVRAYVRRELTRDRNQAHTPMLRTLRDRGFACEYSRFTALYRQVRGEDDGR